MIKEIHYYLFVTKYANYGNSFLMVQYDVGKDVPPIGNHHSISMFVDKFFDDYNIYIKNFIIFKFTLNIRKMERII